MRYEVTVLGMVQGVGFRPFVATVAEAMGLCGSVRNEGGIVTIEVESERSTVDCLVENIERCAPEGAQILDVQIREVNVQEPAPKAFRIVESRRRAAGTTVILPPDIGMCEDCRAELLDPHNRRFHYPYISCAVCGPRYSIMEDIPYDRERITMKDFEMCPECAREYTTSGDRRRHAQTIGCNDCGPQLLLESKAGQKEGEEALQECLQILSGGGVLAIKGIGGYLLACKAKNTDAVNRIRRLKQRESKPFAVMFPSLEMIERYCVVNEKERALLKDMAAPIVLLKKKDNDLAENVCGTSREIGAFLPYTGLHELLVRALGPLVMTSANITSEPIIYEDARMQEMAKQTVGETLIDGIAWNTRKILTPTDDSLVRVVGDHTQLLRRSRGYVPMPIRTETSSTVPLLAFGGDLKGTFALMQDSYVYPSQYFGDLEHKAVERAYVGNMAHMEQMLRITPKALVCDLHPGYRSHQLAENMAREKSLPLIEIQHHEAHVASAMAEHGLTSAIGVAMDGTGYGRDGAIWGCEFFYADDRQPVMEREGHLSYTPLVGGDQAAKDANRSLICQMLQLKNWSHDSAVSDEVFQRRLTMLGDPETIKAISAAMDRKINTSENGSMGRLFDMVAALLGLASYNEYEGECATALENAAFRALEKGLMPIPMRFPIIPEGNGERWEEMTWKIDREYFFTHLMALAGKETSPKSAEILALSFHEAVAEMILRMCCYIRMKSGERNVVLSGGVFANVLLCTRVEEMLSANGFVPYFQEKVPSNDGGIALGQCVLAAKELERQI
ncbi:MAG: carbamoyltransferase HypF [Lachnospiraceae bacterium]|nr:carbamoyltransferase HypF [Lachnospiraceae bacterium]